VGMRQRHSYRVAQVVAEVDREMRDGLESAKVDLLSLWLLEIAGPTTHQCSEVPDSMDVVMGQELAAQGVEVEPAVRRPLQAPVVQVEGVDVDIGAHEEPRLRKEGDQGIGVVKAVDAEPPGRNYPGLGCRR
jgi:hypothetical protein